MPVALRQGGLRYYFFSNEGQPPEPLHIHVKRGGRTTISGLNLPYRLPIVGFNPRELSNILRVVEDNHDLLLKAWHDHFGN